MISVALCTHNGAAYVRAQVDSILNQTHPVDEVVVSDDASADDTLAIVRSALEGSAVPAVVLQNDPPLGVTANFEQAVRATGGDIVILSDQDDVWHPDRVAHAVRAFEADESLLLQFSDARLVDAASTPLPGSLFDVLELSEADRAALADGRAFETMLRRNLATGATVAFRRRLLEDALPFPAAWVHDEWLTVLAAAREAVAASDAKLIDYRQHGANQIGVVRPTLRRKISRVLQARGDRNRGLAERSRILLARLGEKQAEPAVIGRARSKVQIEEFRAQLPAARIRRIIPVLSRARSGEYQRYCSQGRMDIVRDLLQPA